jgi:hypothetical protein
MSAIGTKQTWASALHISAFGGKADIFGGEADISSRVRVIVCLPILSC